LQIVALKLRVGACKVRADDHVTARAPLRDDIGAGADCAIEIARHGARVGRRRWPKSQQRKTADSPGEITLPPRFLAGSLMWSGNDRLHVGQFGSEQWLLNVRDNTNLLPGLLNIVKLISRRA
jgi:hypothetical protein